MKVCADLNLFKAELYAPFIFVKSVTNSSRLVSIIFKTLADIPVDDFDTTTLEPPRTSSNSVIPHPGKISLRKDLNQRIYSLGKICRIFLIHYFVTELSKLSSG